MAEVDPNQGEENSGKESEAEKLRKAVEGQVDLIRLLREEVSELRAEVADLMKLSFRFTDLTQDQKELFMQLDQIQGFDEEARSLAESLLQNLKDQRTSRGLTKRLQTYLKRHLWGILTKAGCAAAPVWQNDLGRIEGGYMRYQYKDPSTGKRVMSESYAQFPTIKLTPRPDLRMKYPS